MMGRAHIVLAGFLILINLPAEGQYGNPFITNLRYGAGISHENHDIIQDQDGIMLFANRNGLLTYNGVSWQLHNLPIQPLCFYRLPGRSEIITGCRNSFGYLQKNEKGEYRYYPLSADFSGIGDIRSIDANQTYLYFLSSQTLTQVNIGRRSEKRIWRADHGSSFNGMIVTGNNVYVMIHPGGLHLITESGPVPVPPGENTGDQTVLFSVPLEESIFLVGTGDSRLFLFDEENLVFYDVKDKDYLEQNILTDGMILESGEIVLATRTGGCLVIDPSSRNTNYTFNYQSGLPDDEIFCMGVDNNQGLWLAHEYGVSRIDFSFPVRNYNIYPGLAGNLTSSLVHNNTLFVSTSEGLFFLNEIKSYRQVEVLVPVTVMETVVRDERKEPAEVELKRIAGSPGAEASPQEQQEQASPEKKGLLRKLFRRWKTTMEEKEEPPEEQVQRLPEPVRPEVKEENKAEQEKKAVRRTRYVRKKVNALQSVSYLFTRVAGLNGKCRYLLSHQGILLAATNVGLYEINKDTASLILLEENIHCIEPSVAAVAFYAGTKNGIFLLQKDAGRWTNHAYPFPEAEVFSIWQESHGTTIWAGGENRVFRMSLINGGLPTKGNEYLFDAPMTGQVLVREINHQPFFFSDSGIYTYEVIHDRIVPAVGQLFSNRERPRYIVSQPGYTWAQHDQEWELLNMPPLWRPDIRRYLRLFHDINDIHIDRESNLWIVHERSRLSKILYREQYPKTQTFRIYFTGLNDHRGISIDDRSVELPYDRFPVEFSFSAPYFVHSEQTDYQYRLEPIMTDWSPWNPLHKQIIFHTLSRGRYTLHARARNILGDVSNTESVMFVVNPPFYLNWWFITLAVMVLILIAVAVVRLWIRKLEKDKQVLEQKVRERTAEIEEQKEEIRTQRDEIEKQRDEIISINREITESIRYASRIQSASLPPRELIKTLLPRHFILYIPRDIVSGDFYWIREKKGLIIVAAGDCTGHGVPGAFMSMLAISSLDEIADRQNELHANTILNQLRLKIITALHQTGREEEGQEGLDISLCLINRKKGLLEYAGAFNPLYHFRNSTFTMIKADKMPIGIFGKINTPFTNHRMKILENDTIYLLSDGYVDQFGGENGSKFKSVNLIRLLSGIQDQPMNEQQQILEWKFFEWKGDYLQVDDVLVIGIKI